MNNIEAALKMIATNDYSEYSDCDYDFEDGDSFNEVQASKFQEMGMRKVDSSYKGQAQGGKVSNLTKNENMIYYHLLSVCYWNSKVKEHHYYYPKKLVVKTELAKNLGMSRATIYRAFTGLIEKGVISESDKYYYIAHPKNYSYIGQKTLIYLINFFPIFGPDVIRVCALLHHWYRENGKLGFSVSDLVEMLGQSRGLTENRRNVKGILSFLHGEGLVDYYITTEGYNGVSYTEYHITGLHLRADNLIMDLTSEEGGAIKEKILAARRYLEENVDI